MPPLPQGETPFENSGERQVISAAWLRITYTFLTKVEHSTNTTSLHRNPVRNTHSTNLQKYPTTNEFFTNQPSLWRPVTSPKSASPQAPMQGIELRQAQANSPFPAVQPQGKLPEEGGRKKCLLLPEVGVRAPSLFSISRFEIIWDD